MPNIFKGLITAIITPFKNNKLDLEALEKILEYQINGNVEAVVVAGSTGEGTSLSFEEYKLLVQTSLDIVNKRIAIIAGCSSNNTAYAVKLAAECSKIKADGFMASPPSYLKPTQEGIYKHFEAIHEASNLPIMLYSVPSRTGIDFTDETIIRLSQLSRIKALKDAAGNLERPLRLKPLLDKEFNLLAGDDSVSLGYFAQGGVGCVSVASNILPKLCKDMLDTRSLEIQQKLLPLYQALFIEPNPICIKYAMHYLGLCSNEIRLPLTIAKEDTIKKIEAVIKNLHVRI